MYLSLVTDPRRQHGAIPIELTEMVLPPIGRPHMRAHGPRSEDHDAASGSDHLALRGAEWGSRSIYRWRKGAIRPSQPPQFEL
jgi:hypothetical protein